MNTKIKSSYLKTFLCMLLLLPLLFVFTACGEEVGQLDTKASCDTSGTYGASTKTEYDNAMNGITGFVNDSYRITMSVSVESVTKIGTKHTWSIDLNGIFTPEGYAFKGKMKATGAYADKTISGNLVSGSFTYYYKNGIVYKNENNKKSYESAGYNDLLNVVLLNNFYAPTKILPVVTEGTGVSYEKNGSKYQMTVTTVNNLNLLQAWEEHSTVTTKPAFVYVNLTEDKKLDALKLTTQADRTGSEFYGTKYAGDDYTTTMKVNVTMSAFDGQIEFPDPTEFNK